MLGRRFMILSRIRNIIFGVRCPGCEKILSAFSPAEFCDECLKDVKTVTEMTFSGGRAEKICSVYAYSGAVSRAIIRFKYFSDAACGSLFARKISEIILCNADSKNFDTIVHIPNCTYDDGSHRRYNQSRRLAKEVSLLSGICFCDNAMTKREGVQSQTKCKSGSERRANIAGAFSVPDPKLVAGKRIIIIDDVATTGATVDDAARALLEAGAARVCAYTAAKTVSRSVRMRPYAFDPNAKIRQYYIKK